MTRKRVLVFTETALALSETFIADHCRSLKTYEPTLVALHASGDHHGDVLRHLLFPKNKPNRLSKMAFRLGISRQLDALIARLQPDLIHAHYLTNGSFMAPYAHRHGIPLVVTAHGHDVTRRLRARSPYDQIYWLRRQALPERAALTLPVSDYLRKILISTGFPRETTRTHYLGVAHNDAAPVDLLNSKERIVFAGRLVEKKGIDMVLAAFTQVIAACPAAELHIVGDGPLRGMVDAKAKALSNITVHGAQEASRTKEIMRSARLLTLPSRQANDGDVEGLGLVLLEAQSLGVPVVTSHNSGTREALVPDKTGFLIDPSDSRALANAMIALLEDPQLAANMGLAGYHFVRQQFDLTMQTRSLETLYDSVVEQHQKRQSVR